MKTIQPVKEAADDVVAMVNFQLISALCKAVNFNIGIYSKS
jgi:hypothetical protein